MSGDADAVRWVDERSGAAPLLRKALRYLFPDHWSFLLGEVALYAFVVLVGTGIFLTLFRYPASEATSKPPALVCPCHYSTFDVRRAAEPVFGPAVRPLPQLPLMVDSTGELRAAGDFSGPVGPSWWGVRSS